MDCSWIYDIQNRLLLESIERLKKQRELYEQKIESYKKAFKDKVIGMDELNSAVQGGELKLSELINIIKDEK